MLAFDPFIAAIFFLFGLAFGSFLNVCIHRLPLRLQDDEFLGRRGLERARLSVVTPASACPACRHPIRWYENIPVVSWLWLRGRCRDCHAPISPRYLIVELLTGLIFAASYARCGLDLAALKFCVLGFLLLGLIFMDAEWHLLPDAFTLPGLLLGLGFSVLVPVEGVAGLILPVSLLRHLSLPALMRLASLVNALTGSALGASFLYGIAVLYERARGIRGMGLGDVKLMAMTGAFLGVKLTIFTLFFGSLVGSAWGLLTMAVVWWKRMQRGRGRTAAPDEAVRRRAWQSAMVAFRRFQLPFGVFLGGTALLATFLGDLLIRWYWRLYL